MKANNKIRNRVYTSMDEFVKQHFPESTRSESANNNKDESIGVRIAKDAANNIKFATAKQ